MNARADAWAGPVFVALDAIPDLGREHDVVSVAFERAAESVFGGAVARCGVEERDPTLERLSDEGESSIVVQSNVTDRTTAETECGDL